MSLFPIPQHQICRESAEQSGYSRESVQGSYKGTCVKFGELI